MKKIIVALLVASMLFAAVSCSKNEAAPAPAATPAATPAPAPVAEAPAATPASAPVAAPAPAPAAKTAKTYTFGMGVTFDDEQSNETTAAYDAVVAVVVLDENGKIVACQIDDAQNKMPVDAVDPSAKFLSKYEKQYDYNMVKFSEATNEWFQQIDAFEAYIIGKTADEVAAMPTRVRADGVGHDGYIVTADDTLFASCSIQITSFKEAVVKACQDPKAQSFTTDKDFTVGLKLKTVADESTDEVIKMYASFGAAVVDGDGVVLAALTDAIQPQYKVADGEFSFKGTKKELEFDYNMVKYSEATNEWFQQAAAFEEYCVGKTGAEIASLPTRVRADGVGHDGYIITADDALFASCSIQITDFKAVIGTAAKQAAGITESTYTLGMGITFDDEQSDETTAAYDAVVATVVLDENGVIVACQIDDAQNKMKLADIDPETEFLSKYEKQFDYNMVKFSEATNEWFQQADAFEAYVVGMTAEEVAAMPTRVRADGVGHDGYIVTADDTLFASCSIQITSFKEAVVKACEDDKAQEFKTSSDFKLGVAINSTAEESTDDVIKMYAEFAGAVVDENGVILACVTDAIQPQYKVADDEFSYKGTKKELEFDYNMVKYSEAENEWFEQAAAFEAYCVGKTADEVAGLPTKVRADGVGHDGYIITADDTLFASCSISIPGFKAVISKAAENAQ